MQAIDTQLVHTIRKFNRFYTNILGLLDRHMLDSDFSLSEARVLFEIRHIENCTAKQLIEELKIDSGYLSRIIKRFEKEGLIYREQSAEDGRLYYLYLTEDGKKTMAKLDNLSNQQIHEMIREGYKTLFLENTEDQQKAIKMYTRVGFKKVSAHKNHVW